MVSGSSDRSVVVWELSGLGGVLDGVKGEVKKVLKGHSGGVLDLRVDWKRIVSW